MGGEGLFGGGQQIEYSTFKTELKQDNVRKVVVKGDQIRGVFRQNINISPPAAREDSVNVEQFITYVPSFGDEDLMPMLDKYDVQVETQPKSDFDWWTILLWVLPFLFLFYIGYRMMQGMQRGGQNLFNIGKSQAKLYEDEKEKTTFDDVAGCEGPKTELKEVIAYLKNPKKFQKIGAEVPKGTLLVGPPGTGKTLLARAVAGEAEVPFFIITGSDFTEMFVGVGAKRVRDLFKKAKEKSPSIIFIDELDSIGRKRGAGLGGGHDEREQTLNQLLSAMDGFDKNENVIVMAATNRPDVLDKALLRPGRFDRQITVNIPTRSDREAILKIHAKNKKFADDVDFNVIARSTPGFTGADLKNLLNEAALFAGRDERAKITQEDIDKARDKVMMGLERTGMVLDDKTKKLLAYHEGGHALVAAALENADPIHKVSIIPRGKAMGVTQQLPEDDKYLYQKEYMTDRLAVLMGGRAAENLIFGTSTSGAENDLKQSTKIARKMVLDWGMSDEFKNMAYGEEEKQVFLGEDISHQQKYSEDTSSEVDKAVKKILENAYNTAEDILTKNREALDNVADLLIEEEEIPGQKVTDLLEGKGESEEE
jgi:cell division protease FtsH